MSLSAERLEPVAVTTLDESRAFQGLTSAQQRFVNLVFSGLTNAEAYRAVYDTTGMAEMTWRGRASELINLPLVRAKIAELRSRVEAQSTLAPNITREFILNGIKNLALTAQKESTQLAAYQTLGKAVGVDLFRDVHVTEKITRTVDDVERELKTRLTELRDQLTIDGDSKPVDAPPAADRRRKPKRGA